MTRQVHAPNSLVRSVQKPGDTLVHSRLQRLWHRLRIEDIFGNVEGFLEYVGAQFNIVSYSIVRLVKVVDTYVLKQAAHVLWYRLLDLRQIRVLADVLHQHLNVPSVVHLVGRLPRNIIGCCDVAAKGLHEEPNVNV